MPDRQEENKKPRSGSEKRALTATLPPVRCTEAQRAAVEVAADRAGLSLSAYILAAALNSLPERAAPVSKLDRAMLAQLLAQMGRIGGNVNQIAKALNQLHVPDTAAVQALPDVLLELRADIMAALGKQPAADAPRDVM